MTKALYVVDTHALLWYLKRDSKLSSAAAEVFQAAERGETRVVISSIVIAELFYLNRKQKAFEDFAKTYEEIRTKPYFQLIAFDPGDVLDFTKDATVPEMHDRIIAGLARRLGAPLITVDPLITAAGVAEIVW